MSSLINKVSPLDRQALLIVVNLMFIVLMVILVTLKTVIADVISLPIAAFLVIVGCLANIIYLKNHGDAELAAKLLIGILLTGFTLGSMNTGGYNGPIVLLAPIIPILSLVLISSRAALITLIIVGLALLGIYALQFYNIIPVNPNPLVKLQFGRLVTLLSLCLVLTWIIWNFSRSTNALVNEIKTESNTDYLTGLFNRRAIETTLLYEVNRAKRTGEWVSLIIADVDNFKRYNDTNGHQMGDKCLKQVAKIIRSSCRRSTDIVGRYGGEEFLLLLPDTDQTGAQRVAESIRSTLLAEKIPYGGNNPDVLTITLGTVSVSGKNSIGVEQFIKCADDALYQGKSQGRNCVVSILVTPELATEINNADPLSISENGQNYLHQ